MSSQHFRSSVESEQWEEFLFIRCEIVFVAFIAIVSSKWNLTPGEKTSSEKHVQLRPVIEMESQEPGDQDQDGGEDPGAIGDAGDHPG